MYSSISTFLTRLIIHIILLSFTNFGAIVFENWSTSFRWGIGFCNYQLILYGNKHHIARRIAVLSFPLFMDGRQATTNIGAIHYRRATAWSYENLNAKGRTMAAFKSSENRLQAIIVRTGRTLFRLSKVHMQLVHKVRAAHFANSASPTR